MREKWIDYLEGELSPSEKQDLELLLKHSPVEQEILHHYQRLWRLIKDSDEPGFPAEPEYFNGLHNQIMTAMQVRINVQDEDIRESAGEDAQLKPE